jgi:hypothetical protein
MFGSYHQTLSPFMVADEPSVTLTTTYKAIIPTVRYTEKLGTGWFDQFAGRLLMLKAFGRLSTSTSPGNLQVGVLFGSNADNAGTNLVQSAAKALVASQSNMSWSLDLLVRSDAVCSGSGSNGKLFACGEFKINNAMIASTAQPILLPDTAAAEVGSLDLTGTSVPSIQMLASAGASIACVVHNFQIFELN